MNKRTPEETTVRVGLGERTYDVVVGSGLLAGAGQRIAQLLHRPRSFVVSDETVAGIYGDTMLRSLRDAGVDAGMITVPAGEASKSFAMLEDVCRRLLQAGIERRDILIALGGGVVGDLAGLAASVLLRGVDFVQIPTTLLAQIDSSVGGKTGIDVPEGKNLVGSFHQPRLVLADTATLDTLPQRELLAGYAELVKYALIGDANFFDWLEGNGAGVIDGDASSRRHAIVTCVESKAAIVERDERESGVRALLNLGHTFGHALEVEGGYDGSLLHGEAVAIGAVMAFDLSARLGLCPAEDARRVEGHLRNAGLSTTIPPQLRPGLNTDRLLEHMSRDKKVVDGKPVLILARRIGDAFVAREVPSADIRAVLDTALNT